MTHHRPPKKRKDLYELDNMCAADSLNMSRSPNAMRKTANDSMSLFKGTNARPVFNGEFKSSMDSYVLRTLAYHSATTWLRGTTKDGDRT